MECALFLCGAAKRIALMKGMAAVTEAPEAFKYIINTDGFYHLRTVGRVVPLMT